MALVETLHPRRQGVYLTIAVGAVAHHGRQLHIVSHQVHIRMTES